jgi:histidine ammonia-lyase
MRVVRQEVDPLVVEGGDWRTQMDAGAAFLQRQREISGEIYGVTTGFGDSCDVVVKPEQHARLAVNLTRFHGCGLGNQLSVEACRAVLAARVASLSRGCSGVRVSLIEFLVELINQDIIPVIPEEGSVGASGDLTPLSYVAAVMLGERRVYYRGEVRDTSEVFKEEGISPFRLLPKESLAIMNGTSVMTALNCLAYDKAVYLEELACRITALATEALVGNRGHFDPVLFAMKPFPGQASAAARIFRDMSTINHDDSRNHLQNRYSIRCAPHVIGVLSDALVWMKQHIEIELNSVNDNPVVDVNEERILHGGHFYGGHMAFVADALKVAVANVADLLDRQLALLVDSRTNNGLPKNLSGARGEAITISHGLKALQIGVSAWTAEALKGTMPASVFSRSTESHNQDKVSMGTIAARDALRVIELTVQVAAACLISSVQAVQLRARVEELLVLTPVLQAMIKSVNALVPIVEEDRALEVELRILILRINEQYWPLYPSQ